MDFLERLRIIAPEAASVYHDLEIVEESSETDLVNTRRAQITDDHRKWLKQDTENFYKVYPLSKKIFFEIHMHLKL